MRQTWLIIVLACFLGFSDVASAGLFGLFGGGGGLFRGGLFRGGLFGRRMYRGFRGGGGACQGGACQSGGGAGVQGGAGGQFPEGDAGVDGDGTVPVGGGEGGQAAAGVAGQANTGITGQAGAGGQGGYTPNPPQLAQPGGNTSANSMVNPQPAPAQAPEIKVSAATDGKNYFYEGDGIVIPMENGRLLVKRGETWYEPHADTLARVYNDYKVWLNGDANGQRPWPEPEAASKPLLEKVVAYYQQMFGTQPNVTPTTPASAGSLIAPAGNIFLSLHSAAQPSPAQATTAGVSLPTSGRTAATSGPAASVGSTATTIPATHHPVAQPRPAATKPTLVMIGYKGCGACTTLDGILSGPLKSLLSKYDFKHIVVKDPSNDQDPWVQKVLNEHPVGYPYLYLTTTDSSGRARKIPIPNEQHNAGQLAQILRSHARANTY